MTAAIVGPPPCASWCQITHEGPEGWDDVHRLRAGREAAMWCQRTTAVHGVTIQLARFADWHSDRFEPQTEIEAPGVYVTASTELSPDEADQVAQAIVAAAQQARS